MTTVPLITADESFDALVCEVSARLDRGEAIDIEALAAGAPEHGDRLRQLLPTLMAMAELATDSTEPPHQTAGGHGDLQWRVLGDYRILGEVGRGGMGIVFEAEQISLARRVALKILPFAAALDPRHLQRFKNEALAAAHLDHPNIVEVYGIGCERSIHFYAMRFVEGITLADVIDGLKDEGRSTKDENVGGDSRRRETGSHAPRGNLLTAAPRRELRHDFVGAQPATGQLSNSVLDASYSELGTDAKLATNRSELDLLPTSTSNPLNSEPRTLNPPPDTVAAALSTLRTERPKDFYRRIAELGIQAADALDHAHQMGIVHRDIKPGNLMIECSHLTRSHLAPRDETSRNKTPSRTPMSNHAERDDYSSLTADHRPLTTPRLFITDFGLARATAEASMTVTGDLLGTLRYMSPEQAEGKSAVLDHRSDIYSLGITLYELVTLRPAFPATDRQALLRQIAQDEPPSPRKLNKQIPADLETIVLKSIAKDPRDRYVSAADLAADLIRFTTQQPVRARRTTFLDRSRRWIGRHAAFVSIALAALILVAVSAITAAVLIARAYRSEVTEHDRAEYNLGLAVAAMDKMITRARSDPAFLGDLNGAEQLMSDALHLHETLVKQTHDPKYLWRAFKTSQTAVLIRYFEGFLDKVEPALRRSSELLDELLRLEPENGEYLDALGENQLELGWLLWVIDRRAQVETPLRRALEIYEDRVQRFPTNSVYQLHLAETLNELGRFHIYAGLPEKAESEIARAAKISASLPAEVRGPFGHEPLRLQGAILNNQALLARSRQDIPQALKLLEQAIAAQDRARRMSPDDERCQDYQLRHYFDRAETFLYAGKHREAAQAIERMLQARDKSLASHHLGAELLLRCAQLATPESSVGNGQSLPAVAGAVPTASNEVATPIGPSGTPQRAFPTESDIAESYRKRAHELVELIKNSDKATLPTSVTADHFAWFLLTCPDESFRDPERAITIAQMVTQLAPERTSARRTLGFAYYRLKKWAEAEAALNGLVAGQTADYTDAGASFVLAMIQWQKGDHEEARRLFNLAIAIPVEKPSDPIVTTLALEAAALLNVKGVRYGDDSTGLAPTTSADAAYSKLPVDVAAVEPENSDAGYLYTIDFGSDLIQRSSLQGKNVETLVDLKALFGGADADYEPRYLDIDRARGKMYWTDSVSGVIRRANLDGSNVETVVSGFTGGLRGIAVDSAARKMYWGDYEAQKIQRANLDGSGVDDLVTSLAGGVRELKLDAAAGKMYWVDAPGHAVRRANVDGSNVETLWAGGGSDKPNGIALDPGAGKVYWSDSENDKLMRAGLDGSGVEELIDLTTLFPVNPLVASLAVDERAGKLYFSDNSQSLPALRPYDARAGKLDFSDRGAKAVYRADLDGSHIVRVTSADFSSVQGIAIVEPSDTVSPDTGTHHP